MADTTSHLEQQVEHLILTRFAQDEPDQPSQEEGDTSQGEASITGEQIIEVEMYRLEGGAVLFVPANGSNPLENNAVESTAIPTGTDATTTLAAGEQQEEPLPEQHTAPGAIPPQPRVQRSMLLVPLLLLLLLFTGAVSYSYVLPLAAFATVTITPQVKNLHTAGTLTIAAHPRPGQVQGRELQAISLTASLTVPATGHAHADATRAQGVVTFYNADSQAYTIPAGVSFSVHGLTIVTETSVTVQAAIPPAFGIAIASAHAIQAGAAGNIPAHAISTRCCGSAFLTATNTTAFSGGQDAKDYRFVQTSDLQNATTTLIRRLTPQAVAALNKEAQPGEQLVTPLCTPHMTSDQQAGTQAVSVTVAVTQTCRSVAYRMDSLNALATAILVHASDLTHFEQVGTTQVIVNGSTYQRQTALLQVLLAGVWVYHLSQPELGQLVRQIAGQSIEQATATLTKRAGIAQVHLHVQRFDFKDQLPTDPTHITIQWFSLIS